MRVIREVEIKESVRTKLLKACVILDDDVKEAIDYAESRENGTARAVLKNIQKNLDTARECNMPMCQDTGMIIGFIRMGYDLKVEGDIRKAVCDGIEEAYRDGYFRKSVVADPLKDRSNTGSNLPPVLYFDPVPGDSLEIKLLAKGFGSENCSRIRMMKPTAGRQEVIDAVTEIVREAGGSPCPPVILGIGLGGTMDYAAKLSKEAMLRPLDDRHEDPWYAELEEDILSSVNKLGIGGGGLGGDITALAVKMATYPTHIAGMPLAVSINCWAERKAEILWN